jgi:ribose transport system substrate-binding protein
MNINVYKLNKYMSEKRKMSRTESSGAVSGTLEKGLRALQAVEKSQHPITIQEIAMATGIQRLAVYRLLNTLVQHGYVQRDERKRYRIASRCRRTTIGYLTPMEETPFRRDLHASIRTAAEQLGFDLQVRSSGEDDKTGVLENAKALLEAHVDVVLFFQPSESVGHMLADCFFHAGVPFITIECPVQGGIYFGANNFQAGKLAGLELGRFARERWQGYFDRVILLEGSNTSPNVQARLAGVLAGLGEVLGEIEESRVVHLLGRSCRESSREAMAGQLRRLGKGTRLLISGFNDPICVGALKAIRTVGREKDVAMVGQNATAEGRAEIRRPKSCFLASVGYFPERYGAKLLRLASAVVRGETVPPAVYTEHRILNRQNIDHYYPEDPVSYGSGKNK